MKFAPHVLIALGVIVLLITISQTANDFFKASGGEALIAASVLLGFGVLSLRK